MNPWAAAALAFGLAAAGYAAGWLTRGGGVAAGAVGAAVLAGSGFAGALMLALFFLSGSLLSAWNARRFEHRPGAPRNHRQVLANGAWAAVGAVLMERDPAQGWGLLAGSLAAAQSDTWATEIGRRSSTAPRLLTSWQPVPAGASGGITGLGTIGGVAGAATLALGVLLAPVPRPAVAWVLAGGVTGMLTDSLLGATLQGRYYCEPCGEWLEQPLHRCGRNGRLIRGWQWLDNDWVNFLACGTGAAVATLGGWLR